MASSMRWMSSLLKIISITIRRRFLVSRVGREGLKQAFKIFWDATPGYHQIEEQIAEGDKVVTRMTSYGKHEGDLPGAPDGQRFETYLLTIHRIANGKLVEKWEEKDILSMLVQLATMKPPPRK
jgi:predicted ester cyclase